MMRGAIELWLIVGLLVMTSGCGSNLQARRADMADIFRLQIGAGIGLYGEVEATRWIHPAVGFADANLFPRYSLGHDPRPGQPAGRLRTAAFPTLLVAAPLYTEPWGEPDASSMRTPLRGWSGALCLMGTDYVAGESCSLLQLHRNFPNPLLTRAPALEALSPAQNRSRNSWLAISGTLGVVSIDGGINPLELLDALLGWFSIDLMDDDHRHRRYDSISGEEDHR